MQTSHSDLFHAAVAMPSTPHAEKWVKSAEKQKSSWKEERKVFLSQDEKIFNWIYSSIKTFMSSSREK